MLVGVRLVRRSDLSSMREVCRLYYRGGIGAARRKVALWLFWIRGVELWHAAVAVVMEKLVNSEGKHG